jgi:hypothetical protein
MASSAKTPSDGGGDRPWQSYHTAYTNAKAGKCTSPLSSPMIAPVGFGEFSSAGQYGSHGIKV